MVTQQATPVFLAPPSLSGARTHYCPGCAHGILHRLVAEVLDELGVVGRAIGVASVGCSVLIPDYLAVDFVGAPHGRAPAVATGVKRARPDRVVFTYQGDGDLAAIGLNEAVHAAARGENITVVLYNNGIYGMTGGQFSPTTLPGQVTATTPTGRQAAAHGYPIRVAELFAGLQGPAYVARTHLADAAGVVQTRRALLRAFRAQLAGRGFSLVEVLGTCPVGWGLEPVAAMAKVKTELLPYFPKGELLVAEGV